MYNTKTAQRATAEAKKTKTQVRRSKTLKEAKERLENYRTTVTAEQMALVVGDAGPCHSGDLSIQRRFLR